MATEVLLRFGARPDAGRKKTHAGGRHGRVRGSERRVDARSAAVEKGREREKTAPTRTATLLPATTRGLLQHFGTLCVRVCSLSLFSYARVDTVQTTTTTLLRKRRFSKNVVLPTISNGRDSSTIPWQSPQSPCKSRRIKATLKPAKHPLNPRKPGLRGQFHAAASEVLKGRGRFFSCRSLSSFLQREEALSLSRVEQLLLRQRQRREERSLASSSPLFQPKY